MKTLLYMAMSVNGIIAEENNSEDFLSHYNWKVFLKLIKDYGCFIWGRKTYELVKNWKRDYFTKEFDKATKVILSTNNSLKLERGYYQAKSPKEALELLKNKGFDKTIITGGSHLNSSFAKMGLIDEVLINLEPVFLGQGISLFAPDNFMFKTKLISINRFNDSGVSLHYEVIK